MKNEYYNKEKESFKSFKRLGKITIGITAMLLSIFIIVQIIRLFIN